MYSRDLITSEINQTLDTLAMRGGEWKAQWITHSVVSGHASGLSDNAEADFFRLTAYIAIREMVRRIIGERAGDNAAEKMRDARRQIELPGFERDHLQDYYLVRRAGEDVGIPIVDLTDDEVAAKARDLRAMGVSCLEHADELDRFLQWRSLRQAA